MQELLDVAKRAARTAADLLRDAHAEDIRSKSNQFDLVTEWDLRSEEAIRGVLGETGLPILGEEGGATGDAAVPGQMRWLVDPIDGTVNFSHGLPIWSISIALESVGGDVQLGVVAAPALGWCWSAVRGQGAFDDHGTPLRVSTRSPLPRAMLASGFPYDAATSPLNNFAEWDHLQRITNACRRLGCASIDLCLVARGWFDGYWERRLSPWDLAAGAVIVVEAGGTVTNTRGGPFDAHSGEAVATNGAIHGELLSELARVRP